MMEENKGVGASSGEDQALVSDQATAHLASSSFDPSREWAVVDEWNFPVAQVYSETAKTVEAKVDVGRRWGRLSKGKVLAFCGSYDAARKISERLKSADGEKRRRETAARIWFAAEKKRIVA